MRWDGRWWDGRWDGMRWDEMVDGRFSSLSFNQDHNLPTITSTISSSTISSTISWSTISSHDLPSHLISNSSSHATCSHWSFLEVRDEMKWNEMVDEIKTLPSPISPTTISSTILSHFNSPLSKFLAFFLPSTIHLIGKREIERERERDGGRSWHNFIIFISHHLPSHNLPCHQ